MNTNNVIRKLTEMMMAADNEKDFVVLNEAIRLLKKNEQHKVSVPCNIGDKLYSIIGEKINTYVITGFRIDSEKIYMESQESMLFAEDKIGIYYFWSHELAEREFNRNWQKRV